MEMFDEICVVRNPLIGDERQLEEIEFAEASVAFANTHNSGKDATELEVDLVNKFMKSETSPCMRKAWVSYRKRLLFHHRRKG